MANPKYNNQVTNSRACMSKGGSLKNKKEKMHRMPNGKMMKGAKHKGK
jgi:hypothetical protein